MGSASSKAARQLPKTAATKPKPSWAGARTPGYGESAAPPRPDNLARPAEASDTRTAAIEQDAADPHFLQKLNQLGPVKVDHHMQTIRPGMDHANRVYQARLQSEVEARNFQPAKGHLFAGTLSDLLEERKRVRNQRDIEDLAKRYEIDVSKLESLARYVNTPTVDPTSVKKVVKEDGSEYSTTKAIWSEPRLQV